MPPIRKNDPLQSAQIEGKIELAISDLKNGRIRSIREAARIYTVPRTTLQDRMNGMQYRQITRANHHKLTQSEEDSLVKWVLDLDKRGLPPPPAFSCTRNGQLSSFTTRQTTSWKKLDNPSN
ncbi:hypothetical protein TMatcc_010615 [Talaromyces marneffei ATCC 18224]